MSFGDTLSEDRLSGPVPLSAPSPPREATNAHESFMRVALEEARWAGAAGEVPVGAVVVLGGPGGRARAQPARGDVGSRRRMPRSRRCARRGARSGTTGCTGATLYVTVEPCVMCAGACVHARIGELVFGAPDAKAGAVVSRARILDAPAWNHRVSVVGGVLAAEARELMQAFFRTRRGEGYRSGRTGLDSKSSWG